ncbi:YggT family protein [Marmoricola sp. OAE513]|uniref:YggT family protein n=1 Tax=Marmoricola sp. OAE513 TaxID=2817894 RepID=UPI001AEA94AB
MNPVGSTIAFVLWAFIGLVFVRLVFEMVQSFARSWEPRGAALVALETVFTITDPPILAFRRIFKPIRIGPVALDLSVLLVLVVCYILLAINAAIWV